MIAESRTDLIPSINVAVDKKETVRTDHTRKGTIVNAVGAKCYEGVNKRLKVENCLISKRALS